MIVEKHCPAHAQRSKLALPAAEESCSSSLSVSAMKDAHEDGS